MADSGRRDPLSGAFWQTSFLVDSARINLYRGNAAEAARLLRPLPPPEAGVDNAVRRDLFLGIALGRLGDQAGAQKALTEADTYHPHGILASELSGARGSVALSAGRLPQAEAMFRTGLDLAVQADARFQQTQMLMNLGVVALRQQHYEDALDRFRRASDLAQSIGAKLSQQIALGNLGFVYYQAGDFVRARDTSRQAASQAEAMGAALGQALWLKNAGMAAFRLKDAETARKLYEKSLALGQQMQSADRIFDGHQALGYLLLNTDTPLAARHIHEATRLAAQGTNQADVLEQQFAEGLLQAHEGRWQTAVATLRSFDLKAGALPSLYWEAESTMAKLYEKAGDERNAEHWFSRALQTFRKQRLSVKSVELQLPFLGNGNDLYFAYMDHLIHQRKSAEALDLLDRSRAETLANGLGLTPRLTRGSFASTYEGRGIAARLEATILVFCVRPGTSYVWSITAKEQSFHTIAGSETIVPLIRRHNQAILASDDLLTQSPSTARALYDALLQPALPLLPTPNARVILIADEELNDLNFETLIPPSGPPHYWIEDVTIANARSLRMLQASTQPQPTTGRKNALLIGDPIYRQTPYPELPNAATELTKISEHFPAADRTVLSGPTALPAGYAGSRPSSFAFIHFVAHATSSDTVPLDSAIVLSPPPDDPTAYRLYARDILAQPIRADLVTLSACYGSGSRNYSGEGLVGLAWAFLRAGAHNVIGALWQVSDASTPQLMDQLYAGLLAGQPPDMALREAKLATLHAGGAFRKPLYWAPFQIYSGS